MDYFDKNFKDQFNGQDSDLPEGFGWEEMKDGIQDKMDVKSAPVSKKWWSLLLLLLLGGCGGWMTYNYLNISSDQIVESNVQEFNTTSEEETPIQIPQETRVQQNSINTQIINDIDEISQKSGIVKNYDLKNSNNSINSKVKRSDKKRKSINVESQNNVSLLSAANNIEYLNENDGSGVLSTKSKKENEVKTLTVTNPKEDVLGIVNSIPAIVLSPLAFDYKQIFSPKHQNLDDINKEQIEKLIPIRIGLSGGMMNWLEFDKNNINYAYLSGFPGFSIRPTIEYQFSKRSHAELAYQYISIDQKFDYEGTRLYQVEQKDVVVEEVINSLTGTSLQQTRRDTFANASQYQKSLHYNKYNIHTLQLSYGYSISMGKSSKLVLGVGAEYLFSINGKGKKLDAQSIVQNFNSSIKDFSGSRLAARMAVNYELMITEKLGLNIGINCSKYFNKIDPFINGKRQGPLFYGLQTGVMKSF